MTKDKIRDYSMRISQTSKTGLVVIMYDIVVEYIIEAKVHFLQNEKEEFRRSLKKAENIVQRLASSLDMKYELSSQLMSIYIFANKALIRAAMRYDTSELSRIAAMFRKLKESFKAIEQYDTSGPVMENVQQVYAGMTYSKSSLNESIYNNDRGFTV